MGSEMCIRDRLGNLSTELPDWDVASNGLERTFEFGDFVKAFSFMSAVALHAERLAHHPEWSNVYGTVRVRLTTHDLGGISGLDVAMAELIEDLVGV